MKHCFAICAYGDSPYLESCLKSLKGQTVSGDIILCTSTPSDYIRALAAKYEVPVFVRTEGEPGIANDWNFAYANADAELVTLAHQDDMYARDYVREAIKAAKEFPDMTVFTTASVSVKGDRLVEYGGIEIIKKLLRIPLRFGSRKGALRFGNPIICPSCCYVKKLCGDNLFDPRYKFVLDWDALWRLAEKPGRFVCVERPLMMYRVHSDTATGEAIRDHTRAREESEMFDRTLPAWLAAPVKKLYQKSYTAYEEEEHGKESS